MAKKTFPMARKFWTITKLWSHYHHNSRQTPIHPKTFHEGIETTCEGMRLWTTFIMDIGVPGLTRRPWWMNPLNKKQNYEVRYISLSLFSTVIHQPFLFFLCLLLLFVCFVLFFLQIPVTHLWAGQLEPCAHRPHSSPRLVTCTLLICLPLGWLSADSKCLYAYSETPCLSITQYFFNHRFKQPSHNVIK